MQNADKQCAMLNVATDEVNGCVCVCREGGGGVSGGGKDVVVWEGEKWVVTRRVHIFSRQLHSFIHPYTLSLSFIQYRVIRPLIHFAFSWQFA